ncbi:MAG: O-antigen ligase family protein [Mastigocoleus sp. MO_167.B18]|nr:O-antigen ligase family protein [Mastigocoleus sp. MO_167.B18]
MNHSHTPGNSQPQKKFSFGLEPPLAWAAIFSFILFTTVCTLAGVGSILRPGYVLFSFAVGILLYLRYPMLYISFTWWIWFITPFVSRVIDLKAGWDPSRFMLVSQFLVTLITLHTALKYLPKSLREGGLPFVLAFIAIFYGFLIGLIKAPSVMIATRGLLDWLTPISFAFYLFINWRSYPEYRKNTQRTFLWGALIMGLYGMYQYLVAPDWDVFWLESTKLNSMGSPEPLGLRVWSTMASPAPFASVMMAALILLFNNDNKDFFRLPATAAGYVAFLLTTVRTLWGGWFVAVVSFFGSLKSNLQIRLIITFLIMALCVLPLLTVEEFSEPIFDRFETFGNLENDNSAQIRQKIYEEGLNKALTDPLGNGIGNTYIINKKGLLEQLVVDSGFLDTFFTLGWFGVTFYLGGLLLLIYKIFQFTEVRFDSFMAAARGISTGMVCTLLGSSGMLGVPGMVMWGFFAMVLAGHKYHLAQRYSQFNHHQYNNHQYNNHQQSQ